MSHLEKIALLKSMESNISLYPHQKEALDKLFSGAILCGGTGSGKSYTALYFYKKKFQHLPLYVITTAKKRDEKDWVVEAGNVGIVDITVDSWNNIVKYRDVKHAFFIFDEQRVIGYGKWSKTFIKIAKENEWILVTATPGDVWSDYIPVFIANGYYRNKSHFADTHIEYNPYVKFPQIKRYHNEDKLSYLRDRLLVMMPDERHTVPHRKYVTTEYDKDLYFNTIKNRWNPYSQTPVKNASELLSIIRQIVASDETRKWYAGYIIGLHDRIIVFYNFDYELEILKEVCDKIGRRYFQWNGKKHEHLPENGDWVYLTQYMAGAEGWNCTTTNVILFYSLNYSYRMVTQSEGRIDRINTPFTDLEYFYLVSDSSIDNAIFRAVKHKKKFNEAAWMKRRGLIF